MPFRIALLTLPALALLAACNSAEVLPPVDERVLAVVETDAWSGTSVTVAVRHATEPQEAPSVTVDGAPVGVSRIDDTTFTAALPVATGSVTVRAELVDVLPVESAVVLHGYLGGGFGPMVESSVFHPPTAGADAVLGTTENGLVEFSLTSGTVIRSWGPEVATLECSHGVQPAPLPGSFQAIGRLEGGGCGTLTFWSYGATLTPVATVDFLGGSFRWPIAIGGGRGIVAWHDRRAEPLHCAADWSGCASGIEDDNHSLTGIRASRVADRVMTLAWFPRLYDTDDGSVVAAIPPHDGNWEFNHSVRDAAFSTDGSTLYVVISREGDSEAGWLQVRDARDGTLLAERVLEVRPFAVAPLGARHELLVAVASGNSISLLVLADGTLETRATLPLGDATLGDELSPWAVRGRRHNQLFVDEAGGVATLVSTNYWLGAARPAVLTRWSLLPP